jgi:signal transduction histidine kinase
MSQRLTTIAAWSLFFVACCQLGLMVMIFTLNDTPVRPGEDTAAELVPLVAAGVVMALAGSAIASLRPGNPIGWLLSAAAIAIGTAFLALAVAQGRVAVGAFGLALLTWVGSWSLFVGLMLFALTLLLFPDGRLPSPAWRWPALISTGALGTAALTAAFGDVLAAVRVTTPALQLIGLGLAVAAPIARYRAATGVARLQLRLLAFATALVPCGLILAATVARETTLGFYFMTIPFALVPIAIGVAVLKYRLYDFDLLIARTLLYGALTAGVVMSYVAVVGGLGALFQSSGSLLISLVATGVVAVLFQPLRERLQRAIERLLYGERADPYSVLTGLGRRLEATLSPDEVLPTIVEMTKSALTLRYCAVEVREDGRLVVSARSGEPTKEPLRIPLSYQGDVLGDLLVDSRGPDTIGPQERQLLNDLARQFAVAVRAVRLTEALRRSRERLVTAREEERRRLRRDLHDGLGPRLAGLTLRLETARDRMASDSQTQAVLTELADRCRDSVADIRRLIYALRPPALDDLGLASAIREGAAQVAAGPDLQVTVEASPGLGQLPAAVEVAAYRIAQEAITNVARHAEARHCIVRLALDRDGEALRVEIQDDGRGRDPGRPMGVGMVSMRERAEELGGSWVIEALPRGGTLVTARLPCREPLSDERTARDAVAARP